MPYVAGSAVEVGSEGVAKGVRAEFLVDARGFKPVLQPSGDLSFAEPTTQPGSHAPALSAQPMQRKTEQLP
jgi:hypothetical protein